LEKVIEVSDLSKLYRNGRGIKNISFDVERGDVVAMLGPNGSGKTTTMKIICGLCREQHGSIKIFGKDMEDNFEEIMSKCGVLIEAPAIYDNMSAYKNLKLASAFYPKVDDERINKVLDMVRLSDYKKEKAGRFSLGMRQRLGLALALLSEPELVILDEPTNGLDIEGMVEIREIIEGLSSQKGTTFLIASHHAGEIEKICNKVMIIYEGEMLSYKTRDEALKINISLEEFFLNTVKEKRGSVII